MSIHFSFYGNHWENAVVQLEERIRMRQSEDPAPDPEFPEAEIDDSERRAAMIRERLRRQGQRR